MGRKLLGLLDAFLNEWLISPWSPFAVLAVLLAVLPTFRESLPLQVSGVQETLYATSAGVGATLLGFLMAVVTLLAVLPDGPLVRRLREQKLLERAVQRVGRASLAMALVTATALAGLIIDRQPGSPADSASELATSSYWVWLLVACLLIAAVQLTSSIVTVLRAVRLAMRER